MDAPRIFELYSEFNSDGTVLLTCSAGRGLLVDGMRHVKRVLIEKFQTALKTRPANPAMYQGIPECSRLSAKLTFTHAPNEQATQKVNRPIKM